MSNKETITIPLSEYNQLKRADRMLAALEVGGVDNWEWYSDSLQEFWAEEDDE